MGHYRSEMEDVPADYISQYRDLGFRWRGDFMYHEPCLQMFAGYQSYRPPADALVRHAEGCK